MFPLLRQVWLGSRECLAPCSPRGAPRRSDPRESRARRVPASGGCQHQAPLALPCPRGALPGKDRFSGGRVPKLPARGRWETGGPVRSRAGGEGSARRHPRNVLECLTPLREGADAAGGQVGGGRTGGGTLPIGVPRHLSLAGLVRCPAALRKVGAPERSHPRVPSAAPVLHTHGPGASTVSSAALAFGESWCVNISLAGRTRTPWARDLGFALQPRPARRPGCLLVSGCPGS